MAPRISIVVPMYNAEKYLAAAVDSVFAQTVTDWELVLSDDGSRDGTLQVAYACAARCDRIRVRESDNRGAGLARNRGAAITDRQSEFIIFLDSDDVWEPNALAVLLQTLAQQPAALAAHGLIRIVDPDGQPYPDDDPSLRRRRELRNGVLTDVPSDAPTTFEALLIENYPVTPGTLLMRRGVWEALQGYMSGTEPCEDWDFNLRLARRAPIAQVDQTILSWRRHPAAISHNTRRWREAYLLVRKRSIQSMENSAAQRAAAAAAFAASCRAGWRDVPHQLRSRRPRPAVNALARALSFQAAYWQACGLR